jgi:hypothetical protein
MNKTASQFLGSLFVVVFTLCVMALMVVGTVYLIVWAISCIQTYL